MATVSQQIKAVKKNLKTDLRAGVSTGVKNSQKRLRRDLGLTAALPKLRAPVGSIRGTRGTVDVLDFADVDNPDGVL